MLDIHATSTLAFTIAVDGDDFVFTDLNAAYARASGVPFHDQVGKGPRACFDAPLAERLLAHYRRCVASDAPVTYEMEYVLPLGYMCWRTTLLPFRSAATGRVATLLGFAVDATAEKIIERSINAFHENLALAVGALDGGFWIYDFATGAFETSRPLAELIAGPGHTTLSIAEYVGYVHADDLGPSLRAPEDGSYDYRVISHDGRTRWLRSKRRVIRDAGGTPTKMVGLVLEVTAQKAAQRVLESESTTDGLTQIKDRRAFERIAARRLRESRAAGSPLGLVFVALGPGAVDAVLRRVARKIGRLIGETDTLARFGDDTFAILTDRRDIGALASRIEGILARPIKLGDRAVRLDVGVGVAARGERDRSVLALIARAESALDAPDRLTA